VTHRSAVPCVFVSYVVIQNVNKLCCKTVRDLCWGELYRQMNKMSMNVALLGTSTDIHGRRGLTVVAIAFRVSIDTQCFSITEPTFSASIR
jgi:hypothetical protein